MTQGPDEPCRKQESKQLVSAWDIPITREFLTTSADQAVTAAGDIGYPVALKVDSPEIPHKTEAGVIRLGLDNEAEVRAAYDQLMSTVAQLPLAEQISPEPKRGAPSTAVNGVLVQEMVLNAVEVIIGVTYDPQLGPVLLFGTGGVIAEAYNDVSLRLCPISPSEAREMIAEVKGSALLHGFRGRPTADVDTLIDTLVRLSYLAVNLEGKLTELDINPLMVLPAGQGVKAADALIVFS